MRIRSELAKVRTIPIEAQIERKKRKYEEIDREIDAWRTRLGEEKENVRHKAGEYGEALRNAQKITDPTGRYKGDEPPNSLVRSFQAENIQNIGTDECRIRMQELESQLECLDDVDPEVIRRFKLHRKNVEDIEQEIERMQVEMEKRKENVVVVRERWLSRLSRLVEEISERFSNFFSSMGFAGMVELGKGEHLNDFANYGIDVLVKFRENVPLQKLDPFKQSGGERSVSTALYMMALQNLTRVPFRCVDEINQVKLLHKLTYAQLAYLAQTASTSNLKFKQFKSKVSAVCTNALNVATLIFAHLISYPSKCFFSAPCIKYNILHSFNREWMRRTRDGFSTC